MTFIRDFQQPERVATNMSVQDDPAPPITRRGTADTTTATTARRRRGSVLSDDGSGASTVRKRRVHRSNTVRTYLEPSRPNWKPGSEPGLDTTKDEDDDEPHLTALYERCAIHITDVSEHHIFTQRTDNEDLRDVLDEPRPGDMPLRWISVNGLSWDVIKLLSNKFGLHRLAVEDLINTRSRTKVDWYSDHAFAILTLQKLVRVCRHEEEDGECGCSDSASDAAGVPGKLRTMEKPKRFWLLPFLRGQEGDRVADAEEAGVSDTIRAHNSTSADAEVKSIRTLHRYEGSSSPEHTAFMERHSVLAEENLVVSVEQVAIFLMADNTVISFFENSGPDVEGPILERFNSRSTMLRRSCDASLLMEAIIDAIVDLALPIKDAYNRARKDMQIDCLTNPSIEISKSLYIFSEEVDMLQALFKPIVHLVNALRDHQTEPLCQSTSLPHVRSPPRQHLFAGGQQGRVGGGVQEPTEHHLDQHRNSPEETTTGRPRPPPPLVRVPTSASASTSVTISALAHTYLGDVLDHCLTYIQSLEAMQSSSTNLSALIFNTVGANTNSFLTILSIVTVVVSPFTIISGYFGMNFDSFNAIHEHSDAFFWLVALPTAFVFMLVVCGSIIKQTVKSWILRATIRKIRHAKRARRAERFAVPSQPGPTTGWGAKGG